MGEKQPSAAATRLAEVAIAEHMRCPGLDSPGWEKYGSPGDCALHRIALALDNAGVGEAVDMLERISLSLACSDLKSWSHLIDEALALLIGDDDAK